MNDTPNSFVTVPDEVAAVLNHDPFDTPAEKTVDPVPADQTSSEDPAVVTITDPTPVVLPTVGADPVVDPAVVPESEKDTVPATDPVVAPVEPTTEDKMKLLNDLAADDPIPTPTTPAATPTEPAAEPAMPDYDFNIAPQLVAALGSEDPNEAMGAVQTLTKGIAQSIHKTVLAAAQEQMVSVLSGMQQSSTQQAAIAAESKRMTDDYFTAFPTHKPYQNLVNKISKQVIAETGATQYNDKLRDAVGARLNQYLQANAGVTVPADPVPTPKPKVVAKGGSRGATEPVNNLTSEIMRLAK